MASTQEEIRRLTEETKVDVPVSPLEGYAAILKELDEVQDEMKLIKKALKEMWQHIREDELPDAITMASFIDAESEKMEVSMINMSATVVAFRKAFIREGGEGWHY